MCCSRAQGFQAQGNEYSYFMLLASAYMLNAIERELQAGGAAPGRVLLALQPASACSRTCLYPTAATNVLHVCERPPGHSLINSEPVAPCQGIAAAPH